MSEKVSNKFTRRDRIRRSEDFALMMRRGSSRHTPHFRIRTLPNMLGWSRLGLVVSKKVGNSCVRNLVKRRIREYFRLNRRGLPVGMDIVVVAKPGAGAIKSQDLNQEFGSVFS